MRKAKFITLVFLWLFSLILPAVAQEAKESLRDPTRPLGLSVQKTAEARLELQAIFIRDKSKEAVINGQSVREGDSVSGALITGIDEKTVSYRKAGKSGKLKLRDSVFPGN